MTGTILGGRYELQREIGRGGMGVVWVALDPLLDREVAIKLVAPHQLSERSVERLRREAQIVARMEHPSIVSVFDIGDHDGSVYFVMPLIRGTSLRHLLRDGMLRMSEVIEIGTRVAEALDYAHRKGVVHRDIKPENILVTRESDQSIRVRVTDFGLAIADDVGRLTGSGSIAGTIAYVSPEQIARGVIDGRSDIYALGTVLYECVTGDPPFRGELSAVLYGIAHELPTPPRERCAEIEERLESLILQCLRKDPEMRPQSAVEIASELGNLQHATAGNLALDGHIRAVPRDVTDTLRFDPLAGSFVARWSELEELQHRLQKASSGECQLVLVGGEAGIGKSRLLEELGRIAAAKEIPVLTGRCVEASPSFPYQGFCELFQSYFRRPVRGSSASSLSELNGDLVMLFPVLGELESLRSSSSLPGERRERRSMDRAKILELLAVTLARIAGGRPLVVILEDLHHAEASLDALQYAVRRLSTSPILFAGTFRNNEIDRAHPLSRLMAGFEGDRRYTVIEIGTLERQSHKDFLLSILGHGQLGDELEARVFEASDGNPFFAREILRSLLDSETVARDEQGVWQLQSDAEGLAIPTTIQQTIERRVEKLDAEHRKILVAASVLGRSFEARELEAVIDEPRKLDDALDALVSAGFLEEAPRSRGERLSFVSGIVRESLYASLSRRLRRSMHLAAADDLERRYSARLDRVYPRLLQHYAGADVPEKVIRYGIELGRRSLAAFTPNEALRALRTVLDFIGEDDPGTPSLEAETRTLLARALRLGGDIDGALLAATEAVRLRERGVSDAAELLEVISLAADLAWAGRRVDETRAWVERGCQLARQLEDRVTLTRLLHLGATVANLRGEYETANRYLAEAGRIAPAASEQDIPVAGGEIVVAMVPEFRAAVPGQITLVDEEEILANVFEPLVTRDEHGNLVPCLAESWEAIGQGRAFVFTLRNGVEFSNGTPLSAAIVKTSVEHAVAVAGGRLAHAFAEIEGTDLVCAGEKGEIDGIRVINEQQIQFTLKEPMAIYPALLTHERTAIVHLGEEGPIGTGPFRIAQRSGVSVRLERNPRFHGKAPHLDAIEFRSVGSAAEIARGYREGRFDLVAGLLPEDLEMILRDRRAATRFAEVQKRDIYFVLFNQNGLHTCDPGIRKKMLATVRPRDIVWRTLGRFADPATTLLPPGILGHDPGLRRIPTMPGHEPTADPASELVRLSAAMHPVMQDRYRALTDALLTRWRSIGFDVVNETPDMESYLARQRDPGGTDVVIGRFIADFDDPDSFAFGLFHSSRGLLSHVFSSTELDQLAAAGRTESDPAARERIYRRFDSLLVQSGFFLPLFHDVDYRIASPRVHGLRLRPVPPYVNYSEIHRRPDAPAGERRPSGQINVPFSGEVTNLDPSLVFMVVQSEVTPTVYETLTRQQSGLEITGWLAESVEAEEGGRRFALRLREGVRFHDGRRLTSRDVRYSFERLLANPESRRRSLLSPIRGARAMMRGEVSELEGLRIHSPLEFSIELEAPLSFFPALLAYESAAIVPEGASQFAGTWRDGTAGTGPFRVTRFDPGRRLDLEANPQYWRGGYPRCAGLTFWFNVPEDEIVSGFREGRFSIASDLSLESIDELSRDPAYAPSLVEAPLLSTAYLALNIHDGPLAEREARLRLRESLDIPSLVRRSLGRLAVPAKSLIPPELLGSDPIRLRDSPSTRRGSQRLAMRSIINSVYDSTYGGFADELSRTWERAGLDVRRVAQTKQDYLARLQSADCDIVITRWVADYPDPDTFTHDVLHTSEGICGRLLGSTEMDRLIEQGREETSAAARHEIYREIERQIQSECILVPLFHEQAHRFLRPGLTGGSLRFAQPFVAYDEIDAGPR